jgi:AcrR family transcriptional regulator
MASYVKSHTRKTQKERRDEILDATMQVISEYGLEGATVSRIAAAVGVTPGALYRHFDNRAALLSEANQLANQRALNWVESSTHPDMLQRLEELTETHAAWAREHFNTVVRPFFLGLASSQPEGGGSIPQIRDFHIFKAFVEIAEEGKRQGTICEDVRPEDVAWAMQMFAWVEDIAVLAGADEFIDQGILGRNVKRVLDSFRPQRAPQDEPEPEV